MGTCLAYKLGSRHLKTEASFSPAPQASVQVAGGLGLCSTVFFNFRIQAKGAALRGGHAVFPTEGREKWLDDMKASCLMTPINLFCSHATGIIRVKKSTAPQAVLGVT